MAVIDPARDVAPTLSPPEAEMARDAQRFIMAALDHSRAARIILTTDDGKNPSVSVPPATLRFIGQVLGALSGGQSVAIVSAEREFTTVEAANFLNVSRPFVVKEMQEGRLPHRKVGSHRRVAFDDLVAYANAMRAGQRAALERMADNARDLGLDY